MEDNSLDRPCIKENVAESFRDKLKLLLYTGKTQLRGGLNRWRLLFLGFALVYMFILLFNLTKAPILWDEVSHLNSGSLLYMGHYSEFLDRAFYPPLFDVLTFISFKTFGISLFAARLPSAIFAVLSLWAVFELAYYLYNGKVGLLSAIILGIMPGVFWLSGYAMLETILIFFVTISLLCFYRWLTTRQNRMLIISGLAFGLGFLAKYQMLIIVVIMLLSSILLVRKQLKFVFKKLSTVIATAGLVVTPWIIICYQVYKSGFLGQWFYVLQTGNVGRSVYSTRFPLPIFYFIEMVWPHNDFHPISIFCYILGLTGLAYMTWRHKREDKFLLLWFAVIFIFYTLIPNKDWRYVVPLFPILAISASSIVLALGGTLQKAWKKPSSVNRKRLAKTASVVLIAVVAGAMFYSTYDTYSFTLKTNSITIDIEGATSYALTHMEDNKSIMVLCPLNFFNYDMAQFYLWEKGDYHTKVFQYPSLAVDAYTPDFNITELIEQCKQYNIQYVLAYEYGGVTVQYYETTLNFQRVYEQLYASGNFTHITEEQTFGTSPHRIFILNFTG
ncbi:MAG: glycosyltransferase family 39 protein [Candidatus Bathyarchaeota archaeon]|nr:glycosyltransferase family 39 protein [Candidatus Termiticorpusculum sp.]